MDDLNLLLKLWDDFPAWEIHITAGLAWMAETKPTPSSAWVMVEMTLAELARRLYAEAVPVLTSQVSAR